MNQLDSRFIRLLIGDTNVQNGGNPSKNPNIRQFGFGLLHASAYLQLTGTPQSRFWLPGAAIKACDAVPGRILGTAPRGPSGRHAAGFCGGIRRPVHIFEARVVVLERLSATEAHFFVLY